METDKRIPKQMDDIIRTVDQGEEGLRLDRLLASLRPEVSRSDVQRQIAAGRVTIDGTPVRQNARRMRRGEQIRWFVERPAALTPRPIPIRILYEDSDLVAVDKPVGLIVHPGAGTTETTLVEALLAERDLPETDDPVRPGIVHRLDKETSGVMVVAKSSEALESLRAQFAARTVRKLYLARVAGVLSEDEGLIEAPVGRDPAKPRLMTVQGSGRQARTSFRVLERSGDQTLVLVRPTTGRTHQIRVHFRYIGHPLLGDSLYGGPPDERLLLHAWSLTIDHPASREPLTFRAPPPTALQWEGSQAPEWVESAERK